MGTCDICGGKTGFMNKFRCQDGVICKNCYKIVSNNFASTITQMTLTELKKVYIRNAQPVDMGEGGFMATRKIGAFLLLDEKNRKFCIINNQKMTGQNTRPEVFSYDALRNFYLASEPRLSQEQLSALAADKNNTTVIQKLAVQVQLTGGKTREITIIPTPVRASSYAFRQGYKVAMEVLDCLAGI